MHEESPGGVAWLSQRACGKELLYTHAHAHAHAHTDTHAHAHTDTHARTHIPLPSDGVDESLSVSVPLVAGSRGSGAVLALLPTTKLPLQLVEHVQGTGRTLQVAGQKRKRQTLQVMVAK